MKNLVAGIFLVSFSLCISSWICTGGKKKQKTKYTVTGTMMQTVSYCGGAQPSQEILDRCNTPVGIANGKLYIKKATYNKEKSPVIDSITTDASGNFSIQLPAGTYCLVEDWKAASFVLPPNDEFQTVDSTCYRNLYNACDYELTVKDKNIDSVKVIFNRTCAWSKPCISYHGPLPPSAPPHGIKGKVGE